MNRHLQTLHLHQFDDRIRQCWADELTEAELELVASHECTVADVLRARAEAQGWRMAVANWFGVKRADRH